MIEEGGEGKEKVRIKEKKMEQEEVRIKEGKKEGGREEEEVRALHNVNCLIRGAWSPQCL